MRKPAARANGGKGSGIQKFPSPTLTLCASLLPMKTAAAQQVPQQWPQILRWLAADEEIELTQDNRVVARILPATESPAPATPDFLARAQAIWGTNPTGPALSAVVNESRGEGA